MKQMVFSLHNKVIDLTFSKKNIYNAPPECLSIPSIQTEPLPNISIHKLLQKKYQRFPKESSILSHLCQITLIW